mmetsp:Transcript_68969/g.222922  ORF Transcript_68969/g.222922 Transcript_68969/m.222922 type:complete len:427 (+) Transcript_68969:59-1339(+)
MADEPKCGQPSRGYLHVVVHGGSGLPAADWRLIKKPSSDPFCEVHFRGQMHRTATVQEELNPTWGDAFTFRVGTFLPSVVLALLGEEEPDGKGGDTLGQMLVRVFDEDKLTSHDLLGECTLNLERYIQNRNQWHEEKLTLEPPRGISTRGVIMLSVCWEPASWLTRYLLHMASAVCFATAFAVLLIAANCRWQPATLEMGAAKQPGVGATTLLASAVMFLAMALQFMLAHSNREVQLDDLAASLSASQRLNEALPALGSKKPGAGGKGSASAQPALLINARATKLMSYELSVSPTVDISLIYLPLMVVAWLLPAGGAALIALAFMLQLQDGMLCACAGEALALLALWSVATGYACAAFGHRRPRHNSAEIKRSWTRAYTQNRTGTASPTSSTCTEGPRQRRRDVFWRHMGETFGGLRERGPDQRPA